MCVSENGITSSYGSYIFNLLRNHQTYITRWYGFMFISGSEPSSVFTCAKHSLSCSKVSFPCSTHLFFSKMNNFKDVFIGVLPMCRSASDTWLCKSFSNFSWQVAIIVNSPLWWQKWIIHVQVISPLKLFITRLFISHSSQQAIRRSQWIILSP